MHVSAIVPAVDCFDMSSLAKLRGCFYDINALGKAVGLLSWDRQVLMPKGGVSARTEHTARLARMVHERIISDEVRNLAEDAAREVEPGSDDAALVRVVLREIDVQTKLPTQLVVRKSRVSSDAYEVWRKARSASDYKLLAPYYEQLFDIARETAEVLGFRDHIYDPLIDLFEEGATYASARSMFDSLKGPTRELIELAGKVQGDDAFLYGDWDQDKLLLFSHGMSASIGFDFNRGRLDITTNAFCSNCSCDDVRLTARSSRHIGGILFSTLHEMGHGLYEQGSPKEWDRTPLAGGVSLGVHESQSRTWENIVGRSKALWSRFYPGLQAEFPSLASVGLDSFYRGINKIQPGPIRIGSDEVTYNFHILIRFELECEILEGKVSLAELPDAWNEKHRHYLGITPKDDGEGCLQDVHWSRGMVGYFPTYSMGNMIGWQVWRILERDIPNTEELMASGQFGPILSWLQEKLYRQAKRYKPAELITRVTGSPMTTEHYVSAMRKKFGDIYCT